MKTKSEADDFDATVAEVMGGSENAVIETVSSVEPSEPVPQFRDEEGVTHTIREPERCLVFKPNGSAFEFHRGPRVEQAGQIPADVPEGADDVTKAVASITALRVAEMASQHAIQIIRVEQSGIGPIVTDNLREAGFYVIRYRE